jgi:hypothetical protein
MFRKTTAATFAGIASIAIAGEDEPGLIEFVFRTVKRRRFEELMRAVRAQTMTEAEAFGELIVTWQENATGSLVDEPYSAEALGELFDEFWNAGPAIANAYARARVEAKEKN